MKTLIIFMSLLSINCFADTPDWVLNPSEAGFQFAIVGSAMPQKMGERAQYKMAEMAARKEYFANKDTYIKTSQTSHTDSTGQQSFESNTYVNSSGLMSFSHFSRLNEWKDPDTQELFLLYVIR